LINPPYAEAASSAGSEGKTDVANTRMSKCMVDYGYASRELFTQFLVRISKELPTATVAIFSKLKYISAPNFEKFRESWRAKYLGGFVVHSKAFDGLDGNFPIGFLVWDTDQYAKSKYFLTEITAEALDKNSQPIGEKTFYNISKNTHLNEWIERLKTNGISIPLKNAIHPQTGKVKVSSWIESAIGYMYCNSNDLQHAGQQTALFSSVYNGGNGFYVVPSNLWKIAVVFSVRRLIKGTWLNDRDHFLQPTAPLSEEFKSDCLIWMLFNGSNVTAGANDLEWNGKKWPLVNHFIPFTEAEVGAPGRFESDFMVQYLDTLRQAQGERSTEAQAVLDAGRTLWSAFFAYNDVRSVKDELKLNRPDVGWYQIRNALKKRNESGDTVPVDFSSFETAYKALSEKLQPQVFELGFLR
jgi:hypothetical protein